MDVCIFILNRLIANYVIRNIVSLSFLNQSASSILGKEHAVFYKGDDNPSKLNGR